MSTRSTRRGSVTAVAVAVLLLAAIAGWVIIGLQQDSVQAEVHSWEDPAGGVLPVTIEVDRDPETALTCELVAVDGRYVIVGQLEVTVPGGGERRQRIGADIPLRGDAVAPKLQGCVAAP